MENSAQVTGHNSRTYLPVTWRQSVSRPYRGHLKDEPLQDQPARPEFDPFGCRRRRCLAATRTPISIWIRPGTCSRRRPGWRARTSGRATSPPTASRRSSTRPPDSVVMPDAFSSPSSPSWTPSSGGWICPAAFPARRRRARCGGRSPRWSSVRTRRSGCMRSGPVVRNQTLWREGTDEQKQLGEALRGEAVGRDDGADRAGRWLGRGRGSHQGDPAAGRFVAHRGRQAVHHQWRARSDREHHPLCAGAPGGWPARAPRGCRCSSCRSSSSTPRPVSWASATASSSPTSSTRWDSRRRPRAS